MLSALMMKRMTKTTQKEQHRNSQIQHRQHQIPVTDVYKRQILISTIDYNEYVGRIGVGKVENGTIRVNQDMIMVNHHDPEKQKKVKISKLYEFDGLDKVEVKEASIGSIIAISGISDISIGDTLCAPENPEAIPFQKISEPTISMNFVVNDSPFAGQEGKYVTSRHLRDRLMRCLLYTSRCV